MLEDYSIITYNGHIDNLDKLKAFNVNSYQNKKTLHYNPQFPKITLKNGKGKYEVPFKKCTHGSFFDAFIPFDSLEEVEEFEGRHGITFTKCGNCFPPEHR